MSGASATQGIENIDGTEAYAVQGRNNTAWSDTAGCVRFIPTPCPSIDTFVVTVNPEPIADAGIGMRKSYEYSAFPVSTDQEAIANAIARGLKKQIRVIKR